MNVIRAGMKQSTIMNEQNTNANIHHLKVELIWSESQKTCKEVYFHFPDQTNMKIASISQMTKPRA